MSKSHSNKLNSVQSALPTSIETIDDIVCALVVLAWILDAIGKRQDRIIEATGKRTWIVEQEVSGMSDFDYLIERALDK